MAETNSLLNCRRRFSYHEFESRPLRSFRQMSFAQRAQFPGEMAEWSIAAVLKTVEGNTSGGSNPSLSAKSFIEDFK